MDDASECPMKKRTGMKIGISSCLIGERVRYDGGHKRNEMIIDALLPVTELVPVCPEMELGMGVPRPPLALAQDMSGDVRMVTRDGGKQDYTHQMEKFAVEKCADSLAGISGYIFKAKSPSCGIGDVPLINVGGDIMRTNSFGLYACKIHRMMPNLPITDEIRLATLADIHQFVERAFVYSTWLESEIRTDEELRDFHRQVRAHAAVRNENFAAELDRMVDGTTGKDLTARTEHYIVTLMSGLERLPADTDHVEALRAEIERKLLPTPT